MGNNIWYCVESDCLWLTIFKPVTETINAPLKVYGYTLYYVGEL